MHIECDEELMSQFNRDQLPEKISVQSKTSILGSWYAGIVKILGNDFLIFVHTKSLYSSVDFLDLTSDPDLNQSVINLRGKILEMLDEEYLLSDNQINSLIRPFQSVTFSQIKNQRMGRIIQGIGIAYQKRFLQARQSSTKGEVRLWELEEDLNNTTRRNLGGISPIETLQELIRSGVN